MSPFAGSESKKVEKLPGVHGDYYFTLGSVGQDITSIFGKYTQLQELAVGPHYLSLKLDEKIFSLGILFYLRRHNEAEVLVELDVSLGLLIIGSQPMAD
ncbi:hypothetical protein HKBW3S09_01713, partial [Candidatus Hakubella thermalkaliphila]